MTSTAVRVALRVRPLTHKERLANCTECVSFIPNQPQILMGKDYSFTYDYVYDTQSSQKPIYDTSVVPLVEKFIDGFNATILAYGQTGSGKTYSMGTALDEHLDSEHHGIVPRFIYDLFDRLEAKKKAIKTYEYAVYVSFLELYNEDLIDLLAVQQQNKRKSNQMAPITCEVQIREDVNKNIYWSGVREELCSNPDELLRYLAKGSLCRTTGSTDMNSVSSRSHAIFSVNLKQKMPSETNDPVSSPDRTLLSKFHFVDLAGSERLKRTNAQGDRAREGISINSGLLALGNVISALGDDSKKSIHVPYRDSKLTRLLQDSLGGNSQTLMMACISPSDSNFPETLSTLKYANRARNIKNKVTINQEFAGSSVELNQLRSQIARLKMEINSLRANTGSSTANLMMGMLHRNGNEDSVIDALKDETDRLKQRIKLMSDDICTLTTERDSLQMERELSQHLGSSEWPHLVHQLITTNDQDTPQVTHTLPIIGQYQKTIQSLRNELLDTQERLAFCESVRGPLMHAMTLGSASITPSASIKLAKSASVLSRCSTPQKSHKRRGMINKKRKTLNSSTTTSRNVTFRSSRKSKVPAQQKPIKPLSINDEDSDIEAWLKATLGSARISETSGLRVDAKNSIENAKTQIDKALKVLDAFKTNTTDQDYECELLADDELFIRLQSEENMDLFGDLEESQHIEETPYSKPTHSRMQSVESHMSSSFDESEFQELYEKNPQLQRILSQIQSDIQVNEDLVLQLETTETEYAAMRKKFEKKMYCLRDEILALRQKQHPKETVDTKSTPTTKDTTQSKDIRQAYEVKMKALMTQLAELRRKYTQTSSTIQSSRNQNESMLRALRINVESLKVEKRRMIKKMKDEAERVKEKLQHHEREIQQLRKKQMKDADMKRRFEKEAKQMKLLLQKKTDESVITAEKLKRLIHILKKAVREGGVLDTKLLVKCGSLLDMGNAIVHSSNVGRLSRRRRSSGMDSLDDSRIPPEIRAAKKKYFLDQAIFQFIQGKQSIEEMRQLLAKRTELAKKKAEYISERKLLISDQENNLNSIDLTFRKVIDENIETVEAEISYLNARIAAIQNDSATEMMREDEVIIDISNKAEKKVTFADHDTTIVENTSNNEPDDEWLDMDALEERYSLPIGAGPEQSIEMISKILRSLSKNEVNQIVESIIDDLIILRMQEHNQKMSIQQLEKTNQDLRRTLIVMKKTAIDTTVEFEKKIRRLQGLQASSRRTSMSRDLSVHSLRLNNSVNGNPRPPTSVDGSDADSAIELFSEESYQNMETIFDKIYKDGISGDTAAFDDYPSLSRPSSPSFPGDSDLSPYLKPCVPTLAPSGRQPSVMAPLKPSTSPLVRRRGSMSSPEQFLLQFLKAPKETVRSPNSPLIKPSDYTKVHAERELSTSSIRSANRIPRRSSIQSDGGSYPSQLISQQVSAHQMIRAASFGKLPQQETAAPSIANRRRAFSCQQPTTPIPTALRRRSLLRDYPIDANGAIMSPTGTLPKSPLNKQTFSSVECRPVDYSRTGTALIPAFSNTIFSQHKSNQRPQSVLALSEISKSGRNVNISSIRRDSSPSSSSEIEHRASPANNVFDRLSCGHTHASKAKKRSLGNRHSSSSLDELMSRQWSAGIDYDQTE
ncbi:hypothetical protein BDB01DRAFT_785266 [Pilobolus umbonatus]|nr:hypothetical protein BDB01DRAFT_785266 [Pilobolus umbonatus]